MIGESCDGGEALQLQCTHAESVQDLQHATVTKTDQDLNDHNVIKLAWSSHPRRKRQGETIHASLHRMRDAEDRPNRIERLDVLVSGRPTVDLLGPERQGLDQ